MPGKSTRKGIGPEVDMNDNDFTFDTELCPRCGGCGQQYAESEEVPCKRCGGGGEVKTQKSHPQTDEWRKLATENLDKAGKLRAKLRHRDEEIADLHDTIASLEEALKGK